MTSPILNVTQISKLAREIAVRQRDLEEERSRLARAQKEKARDTRRRINLLLLACERAAFMGNSRIEYSEALDLYSDQLRSLGFALDNEPNSHRIRQISEIERRMVAAKSELSRASQILDQYASKERERCKALLSQAQRVLGESGAPTFSAPVRSDDSTDVDALVIQAQLAASRLSQELSVSPVLEELRIQAATSAFANEPVNYQRHIEERISILSEKRRRELSARGIDEDALIKLRSDLVGLEDRTEYQNSKKTVEAARSQVEHLETELVEASRQPSQHTFLSWSSPPTSASGEVKRLAWLAKRSKPFFDTLQRDILEILNTSRKKSMDVAFESGWVRFPSSDIRLPRYVEPIWILDLLNREGGYGYDLGASDETGVQRGRILW